MAKHTPGSAGWAEYQKARKEKRALQSCGAEGYALAKLVLLYNLNASNSKMGEAVALARKIIYAVEGK